MIPIEQLQAVRHIVTHENCADGIASAMILKNVLPAAKVTFIQYGAAAHIGLEAEDGMLFCDFSPHKDAVARFKANGAIVLDHHRTQQAVVEQFGELGIFADETAEPGVCGATMAFRDVWLPLNAANPGPRSLWRDTVQQLSHLAGIRDTWQRKDPNWVKACEQAVALIFWPVDELIRISPDQWEQRLELGPVLFAQKLRSAAQCIKHGYNFTTPKGRRVVTFEGLRESSDVAEMLGPDVDLVVGFGFQAGGPPSLICSIRSHMGFDCSAFALAHGGGGHSAAAGFKMQLEPSTPQPYQLIQETLALYEHVEGLSNVRTVRVDRSGVFR